MLLIRTAVYYFASFLNILIVIRCLLSWFPVSRDNPFVNMLLMLTDPILLPIRNLVNRSPLGDSGMPIDFSPLIAVLLINLVSRFIINIL